jgi:hypothetical protein
MGDYNRFRRFAEFIENTFTEAHRIADVAGGQGKLALWLHELGKKPTIIDPRETALPRRTRKILRKRVIQGERLVRIDRLKKSVEEIDLSPFDLVVAMHPDKATEPTLRKAIEYDMDFAIVPCCVYPMDGKRRSSEEWILYLSSLGPGIQTAYLPISGANTVLWKKMWR